MDRILAISQEKRELCPAKVPQHSPRLQVGTSTCLGLPDESVDFVLTSPPYCTRIDYAISTSVELAILGGGDDDLAALRDRSMGTSTIRKRPVDPVPEWGPLCLALIDEISSHPSKSSHSYYRKTYLQYFEDLYRSLGEIERCTRPGAVVAMVVQDSFYKGVHVDLPGIITEMGRSLEWRVVRRAEYPVSRNMRRVNTRSRAYRADVASTETVLWLKTSG